MKPETIWTGQSFECDGWCGEMASRIAAFDWSDTAMGPIDQWSTSKRAAVRLLLASPVPLVMLWGRPGTMIYNDAYAGFAGGRHPFLLGKPVEEGWSEIADFNRNVVDTCLSGATLSYSDKRLTLHRNGQPEDVWMDLHYSPVAEDDGRPAGVLSIVLETTTKVLAERRRDAAERAFREANERLRLALSSGIVLGTSVWDPSSECFRGDERFVRALALNESQEYWPFEKVAESLHPEDGERLRESLRRALERADGRHEVELRLRAPEGQYRWALSSGRCEFDAAMKPLRLPGVLVDIHERKIAEDKLLKLTQTLEERVAEAVTARVEAEERFRQVQKLEAIGNLTGGVAHDFNNVLQIISANLQLIELATRDKPDLTNRLRVVGEAVARGGKLAAQLLAFARRQPLNPAVVNPARLVEDMCEFLQRALPESVRLKTSVSNGVWNLFVDRSQLENALLNLVINSRDAIREGGNIRLEVSNAGIGHAGPDCNLALPPGEYVRFAVIDDGAGMPESVKARMFEPFYSTKAEGQGTGLGLSMVFGFVSQSSGCVDVETKLGEGTTVTLYFPRCEQAEAANTGGARPRASSGGETVLVVEDDPDVRLGTIDMLAQLGYKVLSAQDADAALTALQANGNVDLLFSDVVMPGTIRASELAKIAGAPPYRASVVFASGYTRDIIFHEGRLDEGVVLLKKPFTFDELARTIRHALDVRR